MLSQVIKALRHHWPEYLIEAAGLGVFMISAGVFATLLEYAQSPVHRAIADPLARRSVMGLAMGVMAIGLIYSPWGRQSGVLGDDFAQPPVEFVATVPGPAGPWIAFIAEAAISFGLMLTALYTSNRIRLMRYTGLFAGLLLALYITIEAPFSGTSMNPARTVASALPSGLWDGLWIYFVAPLLGMLLAADAYRVTKGRRDIICAKLNHITHRRCIFRHCGFKEHGVDVPGLVEERSRGDPPPTSVKPTSVNW